MRHISLNYMHHRHVQPTQSSQHRAAKQPTKHNACCPMSLPSHCLSCPTALSHAMTSRGGEGGDWLDLLNYSLLYPPSPPLLSWSWHGERAVGHEEAVEGQRQEGMSRHCVVGCLAAFVCSCLLQFYLSGVFHDRKRNAVSLRSPSVPWGRG